MRKVYCESYRAAKLVAQCGKDFIAENNHGRTDAKWCVAAYGVWEYGRKNGGERPVQFQALPESGSKPKLPRP